MALEADLVRDRRAEGNDAEAELLDRCRQLGQLGRQRKSQSIALGARLSQRHLVAPGSLLDEASAQPQLAKRPPVALRPRQQAVDQQRQHLVELKARRRLGQVEPLHHRLAQWTGAKRGVEAVCKLARVEPRAAETIGQLGGAERGKRAERSHAEPLQRRRQVGATRARGRQPRSQQPDRQRRQECARSAGGHDLRAAPRTCPAGRREGAEAAGAGADAGGGPDRAPGTCDHSLEPAAVQPPQRAGLEVRLPRPPRLDAGADLLQRRQHGLPGGRGTIGIGRDQPQAWAARQRLPQAHPGMDPVRLGAARDLPHQLLAIRLRRQCQRLHEQLLPLAQGGQQLEARNQDAGDAGDRPGCFRGHERMFASSPRRVKLRLAGQPASGRT